MVHIYDILRGEIKKQLQIRGMNYKELATKVKYKEATIKAFMCGARETETVANAIAQALEIER